MLKTLFRSVIAGLALTALAFGGLQTSHAAGDASPAKKYGPIAWGDSLEKARKAAAKDHKVVLMDFYAEWCVPCKQMLSTTYKDKRVVSRAKKFVPILIDVDKQPKLAQKYNIDAIPAVIFLDAKGKVLRQESGYHDANEFLKLMNSVSK